MNVLLQFSRNLPTKEEGAVLLEISWILDHLSDIEMRYYRLSIEDNPTALVVDALSGESPAYFIAPDGRKFPIVITDASPAATLSLLRAGFAVVEFKYDPASFICKGAYVHTLLESTWIQRPK